MDFIELEEKGILVCLDCIQVSQTLFSIFKWTLFFKGGKCLITGNERWPSLQCHNQSSLDSFTTSEFLAVLMKWLLTLKMYKLSTILPIAFILPPRRSYTTHRLGKKATMQCSSLVSLVMDIRLKQSSGAYKTFFKDIPFER